ncbi:ExbD/TolR family protein [Paraburkholderia haematera]|uniref:Biopolymer transport protein ExbD n=1 Tax=Paraburkholderia haematera TaxID=2793077 RepID=A0ABN7L5P2_9BURK|nr:biopolymer transporter ExbD [Paraburkholderia haematera]CAE6729685.1 Biopolymer transport protein ExbD [Paraburkholderia haematera]
MGMNIPAGSNQEPEVLVEINTTPLIDVMLVLLIMLIITIPIQSHAVKMNMPVGTPPPIVKAPPVVQVDVDFDGTISWNGAPLADLADLDQHLKAVAQADQLELHLRPNRLVPYRRVAAVMAAAQRQGVTKIALVGNEQFMQ